MIKAVVFDFGGVMTTCSMPERLRAVCAEIGLDWQVVADGFKNYRLNYDQGVWDINELYKNVLKDVPQFLEEPYFKKITDADTASWLYRNEKTRDWMRFLRARGFKIGILTNMPPSFAPLFKEHFADFIATAHAMVISGEEHLVKPMPEIYHLVEERFKMAGADFSPSEICFIDDVLVNCEAAAKCGWQYIQFKSNQQVEDDFERLLAVP